MKIKRKVSNILVTGGSGFIGSAFIRYLLKNVPHFKGLCLNFDLLTYAGNPQNLKEVENDPRYLFHQGDIKNEVFIEHLCREYAIDTIIHFAAESHVDRSIHGPKEFIETNVLGTFHLLEVIRRLPHIHFHHVSTDEVYGCLGNEGFFTESTPYAPNSPYSASKASSDHLVRAYGKTYHLSTCISNCSNNYGPYHFPEKLIPLTIINCLRKNLYLFMGKVLTYVTGCMWKIMPKRCGCYWKKEIQEKLTISEVKKSGATLISSMKSSKFLPRSSRLIKSLILSSLNTCKIAPGMTSVMPLIAPKLRKKSAGILITTSPKALRKLSYGTSIILYGLKMFNRALI
ncbi:dTDP-glucose 4,6-dehydratase [Neochlamydia sp. TUME1]|nr:dTDP-glucose 4,6-dehydratase [Neochlamydia sp. TUME1]